MKKFKLQNWTDKKLNNKEWQELLIEPTFEYDNFLFVKIPRPSFDETWDIFIKNSNKEDFIGCASLFYFEYYQELEEKIIYLIEHPNEMREASKSIKLFTKKYMMKWMAFIERSDDSLYPQNTVIKRINSLLINMKKI